MITTYNFMVTPLNKQAWLIRKRMGTPLVSSDSQFRLWQPVRSHWHSEWCRSLHKLHVDVTVIRQCWLPYRCCPKRRRGNVPPVMPVWVDGYGSNSQTSTNKSSAHGLNGSLLACRLCSPKTGDRWFWTTSIWACCFSGPRQSCRTSISEGGAGDG